jgi:hypothetical protein
VLALTLFFTVQPQYSTLLVYASGTPDAYGNRIVAMYIKEWNSTSSTYYTLPTQYTWDGSMSFDGLNITYGSVAVEYSPTSGFTWQIQDNNPLQIWTIVAINRTLTTSNPIDTTRVYINITGVVAVYMSYWANGASTNFNLGWFHYDWNATGQPNAGTTYSVAIRYEAYY